MADHDALNIVYTYQNAVEDRSIKASYSGYSVASIFSFSTGKVAEELITPIYESLFNQSILFVDDSFGPFYNLNDLNVFAAKLAEEVSAPYVYIVSAQDFNSGIEVVHDVETFTHLFSEKGLKVDNHKYLGNKSKFFNKIFRD